MSAFADDPELVATFRAEVEDRLSSLSTGLLGLEGAPNTRQAVTALFRDAHTVKGSARMLGLDAVVRVAHASEDLLGAVKAGKIAVRREVVDLLLTACDAIGRAVPGAADPVGDADLQRVVAALGAALGGGPVTVPELPRQRGIPAEEADDGAAGDGHSGGTETVRVAAAKVLELLDVVGEAELGARRLEQALRESGRLAAEIQRALAALRAPGSGAATLDRLERSAAALADLAAGLHEVAEDHRDRLAGVRDGAMGLAMVPMRRVVAAYPRLVRELAHRTGKEVDLVLDGEDVEIDKQVLDAVADALGHLVTNAVDHGCETVAARRAAGKPPVATVAVRARSVGGTVTVEVCDDGAGVDEAAVLAAAVARGVVTPEAPPADPLDLLFAPAFSTRDDVTETSGRGVGLDVVRTAVEALGGTVAVSSVSGGGTTFTLTLPVTLGVLRCLLVRAGAERYAVPVSAVVETVALRDLPRTGVAGSSLVVRDGVALPLLDLAGALDATRPVDAPEPRTGLVARHGERTLVWAVDRLDGEAELVVKDLGGFLGRVPGVTGAVIDGDGLVVCVLDLRDVAERSLAAPAGAATRTGEAAEEAPVPRVLVVEDSVGVRELERAVLSRAGFRVETCVDGAEGAARLAGDPVDLVVTDVEMPGMDGFAFTRALRRTAGWEHVPVVVVTSLGGEEDRRRGLDAGADAYLDKNTFQAAELVATVTRLLGT